MRGPRRSMRLLGALADQAAFAIANLWVTVAVARSATPAEFGMVALLQLGVALTVQWYRQTVGASILLTEPGGLAARSGLALTIPPIAATGFLIFALGVMDVLPVDVALVAAAALASALLQERARLDLQSRELNQVAGAVGSLQLAGVALLGWALPLSAVYWLPWLLLAATAFSCWGLVLAVRRVPWSIGAGRRAVSEYGLDWARSTGAFAVQSVTWAAPTGALGVFSGAASVAALRGGQSLVALAQQLPQAAYPLALQASGSPAAVRRVQRWWVVAQIALFASVGTVLLSLNDEWGRRLLGQTWLLSSPLIMPLVLAGLLAALSLGVEMELRALGAYQALLRARTRALLPYLIAVVAAGAWLGTSGVAWSIVFGQGMVLGVLWRETRAARRLV